MKKLFLTAAFGLMTLVSSSTFAKEFKSKWDKFDWEKVTGGDRGLLDFKYGAIKYKNKTLSELLVKGTASVRNVNVTGESIVHGTFKARGCNLNSVENHGPILFIETHCKGNVKINGPAKIYGSSFEKKVRVSGPLEIEGSDFKSEIRASSRKLTIKDSRTKDIVISSKSKKDKTLRLAENSIVDGSIRFLSEKGDHTVIIEKGSRVNGIITGAAIEDRNS